jgi:hypothetical protein
LSQKEKEEKIGRSSKPGFWELAQSSPEWYDSKCFSKACVSSGELSGSEEDADIGRVIEPGWAWQMSIIHQSLGFRDDLSLLSFLEIVFPASIKSACQGCLSPLCHGLECIIRKTQQ